MPSVTVSLTLLKNIIIKYCRVYSIVTTNLRSLRKLLQKKINQFYGFLRNYLLSCKEEPRSLVITVTHKLPQSAAFIALFPIGPMPNPSAATVMGDTSQLLWHDLKPLLSATVTNEWAIQALLFHRTLELSVTLLQLSR